MRLADLSIKRPVFAVMLIAALLVFGCARYPRIGVDLFPNVEFPVVTVTVVYPGADPETMESKVADPIEEAINTLSGIKALRSVNLESVTQVVVEFELEVPTEQAVQDIRDRVSGVLSQLPEGIDPPVVQKFDVGAAPIMSVALAGAMSATRSHTLGGQGRQGTHPARTRRRRRGPDRRPRARDSASWSIRSARQASALTVQDVADAIRSQNLDAARRLVRERQSRSSRSRPRARSRPPRKSPTSSCPARRFQPARARRRPGDRRHGGRARSVSYLDGKSAVSLVIRKQSGSNTVAVAHAVREEHRGAASAGREGRRHARDPDRQLRLHRALDPRRAVRPDVRRVARGRRSSCCSCATCARR